MPRIDWQDEQSIMNAFVEAVLAGGVAAAGRVGRRVVKRYAENGPLTGSESVRDGTLLRFEALPTDIEDRHTCGTGIEALEPFVTPERYEELEYDWSGHYTLTEEELRFWRKAAAEAILTENPDCDVYPLWAIFRLRHSDGREAFLTVLSGGYSFTTSWNRYLCGTASEAEALETLRRRGFTDVEDFRARDGRRTPVVRRGSRSLAS